MNNWIFSFIDILGFANEVQNISSATEMTNLKRRVTDFVSNFASDVELDLEIENSDELENGQIIVKSFSDSVMRAKKLSDSPKRSINDEFQSIIRSTRWCLQEGYLIRGGITIGAHFEGYSEIPGNQYVPLMISPALIEAYKIETTIAKYPRVVVDGKIIEWLTPENKEFLYWYRNIASLDYLWSEYSDNDDPGSDFLVNHANLVTEGVSKFQRNPKLKSKFKWLKSYHNKTMEKIFREDRIEDADISDAIQREAIPFI